MKIIAIPFLWNHWRVILYTLASIATALALVFSSQDEIGTKVFDFIAKNQEKKLVSYLEKESEYVSKSVIDGSKRKDLLEGIQNRDTAALAVILQDEKKKTGLTAFTVVNEYGTSLSRAIINANIGDNVFLTLPVGRMAANGITEAQYGAGRNFSLTLGAGSLVKKGDGEVVGGFFGGYWFDNAYAQKFKLKYLQDVRKREVIFYSKEEGETGSSIDDVEERNKVRAYLDHSSSFTQDGRSGDLLNLNGKDYVVTNYSLSGQYDTYGGVLLLTPLPLTLLVRSFIGAFITALLFFISLLIVEKISIPQLFRFRKKRLYSLLLCLSSAVLVSLWVGIYSNGKAATTYVNESPMVTIYNSIMKIRPDSGVYAVGYQQQASVIIYSGGEKINAVDAEFVFDPKLVRVENLSFDRSICDPETIVEKKIDNDAGVVSVGCIITSKVFAEARGIVVDINFTPLSEGGAAFIFNDNNHVFAADGLATDVLRSVTSSFYRIFKEEDLSGFFSKKVLVLPHSLTHENSSKWYNEKQVTVVWPTIKGAEYVYEFSKSATTTIENPTVTSSTIAKVTADADGTYYFKLAAKRNGVTGLVSTLKINIDTTSPDSPLVKVSDLQIKKDDIVRFEFSSDDEMSRLQKNFYIRMNGSAWLPTSSKLYMPFRETGNHSLRVRVFDNAENYSETEVIINVTK